MKTVKETTMKVKTRATSTIKTAGLYPNEAIEESKRISPGYCTRQYKVFTIPSHQRIENDGNTKSIIKSIQGHGVISAIKTRPSTEHPGKLEVWDGQNTLAACRILDAPVDYDIYVGITNRAIIAINGETGKKWTLQDYLKYGIEDKLEDYIFIHRVHRDNRKIALTGLLTLFGGAYSNQPFKRLEWKALSKVHGFDVLSYAKDFAKLYNTEHWFHARFLWGLSKVVRTGLYNHERMLRQMDKCSGYLTKQGDPTEYAKNIEMVYNYNMGSKNKVQFVQ